MGTRVDFGPLLIVILVGFLVVMVLHTLNNFTFQLTTQMDFSAEVTYLKESN